MGYPHFSGDCAEYHGLVRDFGGPRPTIVTLCGSTRFRDTINDANARPTLAGNLVISLGVFGHLDMPGEDWTTGGTATKVALDQLHKRKIDLADVVYVVNPGGYIGESTRSEIDYALARGKRVEYLEPIHAGDAVGTTRPEPAQPLCGEPCISGRPCVLPAGHDAPMFHHDGVPR